MNSMNEIAEELLKADNFLVLSHMSPDGDTLGSSTALIRALRKLGKKANFACSDEVPEKFSFLFKDLENENFEVKTIVTVDVANPQLLGSLQDKFEIDIVIDHHSTNNVEANFRYVDGKSASNTMIIYDIIKLLNVEICKKIADSLYTGLSTDTGCFKFSNAGSQSHRIAAELIDLGADFKEINRVMFDIKTRGCMLVESEVMSTMEFCEDNKILCAVIPFALLKKTGAKSEDLESIPSLIRSIEGVVIGITLKEKEDGTWKGSVRAVHPADAGLICQAVGGGGHRGAGGCLLTKNLEESKSMLIKSSTRHLKELSK